MRLRASLAVVLAAAPLPRPVAGRGRGAWRTPRIVGVTSPSLVVAMATMPRPTPGNPPGSYCPVSGTSQVAIRNVCADFGAELREFNSETGHVHLLVRYPPRVALSRLVGSLMSVSARRLRQEFPGHIRKYLRGEHFWSPSYFAASCGGAPLAIIKHGITPSRHQ